MLLHIQDNVYVQRIITAFFGIRCFLVIPCKEKQTGIIHYAKKKKIKESEQGFDYLTSSLI